MFSSMLNLEKKLNLFSANNSVTDACIIYFDLTSQFFKKRFKQKTLSDSRCHALQDEC